MADQEKEQKPITPEEAASILGGQVVPEPPADEVPPPVWEGESISQPVASRPPMNEEVDEKDLPDTLRVEGSQEIALPGKFGINIRGFDELPPDMLRPSWIYLVQPGSSKTILANGEEAKAGNFYLKDRQAEIPELEMVVLRCKRRKEVYNNKEGVSLAVLALNVLDNFSPFLISFRVTSFGGFTDMIKKMKRLGAKDSWEYPVTVTTEMVKKEVLDDGVLTPVKYFVAKFVIGERLDDEKIKDFEAVYKLFGGALDRSDAEEEEA